MPSTATRVLDMGPMLGHSHLYNTHFALVRRKAPRVRRGFSRSGAAQRCGENGEKRSCHPGLPRAVRRHPGRNGTACLLQQCCLVRTLGVETMSSREDVAAAGCGTSRILLWVRVQRRSIAIGNDRLAWHCVSILYA